MFRAHIGLVALLTSGCAALIGIEETTTISGAPDGELEGGTDGELEGGTSEPDADADVSFDERDAGTPIEPDPVDDSGLPIVPDSGTSACTLGKPEAFIPAVSGVSVEVCNPGSAITQGGSFTGLDCTGAGVHEIDGIRITACVGINFPTPNLASATVRLFAVGKGCFASCYGAGCTNDATARIFIGTGLNISTWHYRATANLTGTPRSYTVTVPAGEYRVLGICRGAAGAQYDDVGVDGVTATCR